MHMKKIIKFQVLLLAFLFIGLAGCGKSELPEVNEENCKRDNVRKIKDDDHRREFAEACFGRKKPIPRF
jgi:entry exclusion lipoprotein TrbK